MYRAQVRLRGAQDNQLDVLGEALVHEQSHELDAVLTAALCRALAVEPSQWHAPAER